MKTRHGFSRALVLAAAAGALVAGCGPDGFPPVGELGHSTEPLFVNGGFEDSGGSLANWTVTTYLNNTGLAAVPPTTFAQLQLSAGGTALTFPRTNASPESQVFAGMTAAAGIPRWPKFGTTSAVVNETNGLNSTNANSLKQQYVITNADVDPSDGKVHVRFVLAPALQAAGHIPSQQPYFFVILNNLTTAQALYTNYNYANDPGVPWKAQGTGATAVLYTDWRIFDVAPGNVNLRVGDNIELTVIASRCQPSGHFGEVYVDGFGAKFPGLSISKTAPSQANLDSDITYSFLVENLDTGLVLNAVADEVLPLGTTFVSLNAPGLSCTTPAVGGTGTVSCALGNMNPSASATFQVTVHALAPASSGSVSAATATTLTDSTKAWTANAYAGWTAYLVGGQGVGQYRTILSNTATQLTVTPAWTTTPNATSAYKIVAPPFDSGTVSARSATTITDSAKGWLDNKWVGSTVTILSGTGIGQQRRISANTNTVLTVDTAWTTNPPVGSTYSIGMPPDKVVNGNYSVRADTVSPLLGPKVETAITAGVQYTDLAIAVTDGVPAIVLNGPVQYTITVTNNGPLAVTGATVTDNFPAQLSGVTWTCAASAGGSCTASGTGNINQAVNLPAGGTATFTVNATNTAGSGTLTDLASVATPTGIADSDTTNNSDADTDDVGTLYAVTVNKDLSETGRGTVTSVPAAISCGAACSSASAQFLGGSSITLNAVARPGDTFTGWAGGCTGTSLSCTVTVAGAMSITAHFAGPSITGLAGSGGTVSCVPSSVLQGGSATCSISPDADHVLLAVTDNGVDVTASVVGGIYALSNVLVNHTVSVSFNARPNLTTTAPTAAGNGVAYSYAPSATDSDGPAPLVWSRDSGDTCGGTVNAGTGVYAFMPGSATSCAVGIRVCDSAPSPACRVQLTTVTVNQPPVTASDSATTRMNVALAIPAASLIANDSPGSPPSESGQTLSLVGVSAASAQGGTVSLSGGVVTYTPPAGFSGSDSFTYTVADNGTPSLSSTGTVNVTVVSNYPPVITSTAPTTATEDVAYAYNATVSDPDGPGATWSLGAADTCGGTINAATGAYAFTPTGPTPPASCVVSVRICDGGAPNLCATQTTTVSITPVNDAPVITSTAPTTATEDVAYAYNATELDPDGPRATWSVEATDTCGGTINAATGAYTFTPSGPVPPASCIVSIRVCDGGAPNLCAAETAMVFIAAVNDAPAITSSAPATAAEGVAYAYNATASDPDGPGATWSVGAADTCGGTINAATGAYAFTPAGPTPPASCVVSVKVCDGGAPNLCATQTTTVTISAVNNAPVITSTAPTTATEDVPYTYGATELDPDGPGATWSLGAGDTCGGTINAASGAYAFTPAGPTPPASCVVSVKVCDGGAPDLCATQTTTVTISAVNNAPVITSAAPATATEDVAYAYGATELDPDGPGATWSLGAGDTCGGTINAATGAYAFTPAGPTPPASCVVSVKVCDGGAPNLCATQTTTVTIAAVNDAPVITSSAPTTATEGVAYAYGATELDPDGPGAIWSVEATDTCGGTINAATGAYTFTPAGPTPPASCIVSVKVCDGASPSLCATQTTTVTITAVNNAPVITSSAPATASEGVAYAYNATASDPDGPGATWSLGAADTCGGTINAAAGAYAFTPAGPTPPASCVVSVRVCDGGAPDLCATQTTTVTIAAVNDAPVITSSAPATATEGTAYAYAATVLDPDGPGATWSIGAADTCGGTINPASGAYTFTPAGPTPPASCIVSVEVCDGASPSLCATQTTTVTITAVNNAPVITSSAPTTATEGTGYAYGATALDPDGPAAIWSRDSADTCGGTLNAATGVYTFTPAGPVPPASCIVSVKVCDGGAPDLCATQTTTVSISAVNEAPVITSSAPATATEDTAYAYAATVLDPDGPGATWSIGAADTCGGTINPASGTYAFTPAGPTPPANCVVSVKVCDGGAPNLCATQTTTVTITAGNNAPVITSTAPTTGTEDVAYAYNATELDPDGPGATWSVEATDTCGGTINAATGAYTFTPAGPTPPASCIVSIKVCDQGAPNLCAAETTVVFIAAVNDAPVITSSAPAAATEDLPYSYPATESDPDGPTASWSRDSADTCGGTLDAATGLYAFTPAGPTPPASCIVSVKVCDGASPSLCATQTTTVTLTAVNDAPVITSTAPTTAAEDVPYTYDATGLDPDGPAANWTVGPFDTCGGTINAATGAYTFTPAGPTPPSSCQVSVRLCDGGAPDFCAFQTTIVTITTVNQPPVITSSAPTTATEDVPYAYGAAALDPDGPGETWSIDGADTCGGTINAATGAYSFTPPGPTPPASCAVSVKVCDGASPSLCATQTTTVAMAAVNDAPVITSSAPATATEDEPYAYVATSADPDGPGAAWSVGSADTCGGTIDATGAYAFTPAGPTPPASCTVSVKVCDQGTPELCTSQTTVITITAINGAPVITSTAPATATEDEPYSYPAAALDPDGPGASWSVEATDTCGGAINADTGAYTFTPAGPTPPASCVVSVKVCDGATPSLCTTQTATITIAAVNDAPVITSTAPAAATEDQPYSYSPTAADPDGPGATWTVDAADTCVGTINPATGAYAFTPAGPTPPSSCTVSVKVCDQGTPELCTTQTATVSITAVGFRSDLGISGGGCGCNEAGSSSLPWIAFAGALLASLRRSAKRRRHRVAGGA